MRKSFFWRLYLGCVGLILLAMSTGLAMTVFVEDLEGTMASLLMRR